MTNKRWASLGLLCFLVISGLLAILWFYVLVPKPDSFPTNKQLITQMNKIFPAAAAEGVQDIVPIDKRHNVVPYFSEEGNYGISYWEWKWHKWQLVYVDTTGEPRLWKIDKDNPSTYYFVWNIQPSDQLRSMKFFFIRDRQFYSIDGIETYNPKIQLEAEVKLEKSFGILPISDKWIPVIKLMERVENSQPSTFYGWTPYNLKGQEATGILNNDGESYYVDDVNIEDLMILGSGELEVPGE